MDALTVLRREHTRIAQLFTEFDALPQCACTGRKALVREIDELVRRHIEMEEALIYQRLADPPKQEHQLVLQLLDEIGDVDCRDAMYVGRVQALRDVLLRHIKEEEAYIFTSYAEVA